MRIGHFVSFGIGGADQAAYRLIEAQLAMGLSPIVISSVASRPSPERSTRDQDPTGQILSIEENYQRLGAVMMTVKSSSEIASLGLDILHTHRSGEDTFLLEDLGAADSAKVVVETNFHGYLRTPADVRVFPSHTLMRFRKIPANPSFHVIPNPVMTQLTKTDLRTTWGVHGSVTLGRLSRSDKSAYSPKLLVAYRLLKSMGLPVRLVWGGASSMARKDAKTLGLDDIVWLPTTSDPVEVSKWFNSFDVYCHVPRLGETFGNTVAEAMMHGKPVVSWSGPCWYPQAQREILSDKSQNVETILGFVKRAKVLIDQPSERARLGNRNREIARQNFSPGSVAEKYLKVYEAALAQTR